MRFVILVLLIVFLGCEKFDATNVSCDEKNKCPENHFCHIDKCVESNCKGETKDKFGENCAEKQECNLFTGMCGMPTDCDVNGLIKIVECPTNKIKKATYKCIDGKAIIECEDDDECTHNTIEISECGFGDENPETADELTETEVMCYNGKWLCSIFANQTGTDNNDWAYSTAVDSKGNIYITGETKGDFDSNPNSGGNCGIESDPLVCADVFVVKYDKFGIKTGATLFGRERNNWGAALKVDSEDNIIIVGSTDYTLLSTTNTAFVNDVFIRKYNSNLEVEWTKELGGYTSANYYSNDYGLGVALDSNDNIYITGHTTGEVENNVFEGEIDYFLVKYNKSGIKQWSKQFGTTGKDLGNGITVTSDGFIYITGSTTKSFKDFENKGGTDIFISKFDIDGNLIWTKQEGTSGNDEANKVVADGNNVYITGYVNGILSPNVSLGESDAFLIKYDSNGNKQWSKQFGTSGNDGGNSIAISGNGNIYVTGSVGGSLNGNDYFGGKDIFLSEFDSLGNNILTKQWGTINEDDATDIVIDSNNYIYISGKTTGNLYSNINSGGTDAFLIKWKE